jgi:hypothetical protein
MPGSIVPGFRTALLALLRESEFPYFEMVPFESDTGPVNPEARMFLEELKQRILIEARESEGAPRNMDTEAADVFAGVLAALAGLSLTSPMWHPPLDHEIAGLFAGVLAVELDHWHGEGKPKRRRSGIQRFLANESTSHIGHKEASRHRIHIRRFMHLEGRDGEESFTDFYRACTYAQARLIDYAADSLFLIRLLRFVIQREAEQGALFPFVRGLAEDVIVRKRVSHEEAPGRMANALQAAEYFSEFEEVLGRILSDWEGGNG